MRNKSRTINFTYRAFKDCLINLSLFKTCDYKVNLVINCLKKINSSTYNKILISSFIYWSHKQQDILLSLLPLSCIVMYGNTYKRISEYIELSK